MPTYNAIAIRVDFNVPISGGTIMDTTRIDAALPEIKYWLTKASQITLISHFGRPQGMEEKYSLRPIARYLSSVLKTDIPLLVNWPMTDTHPSSPIRLAENIRFFQEEEQNDQHFCQQIAKYIDLYVFEAFAVAHRHHASTLGVMQYVPVVWGSQFRGEVNKLREIYQSGRRVLVLGGAKTASKIGLLKGLIPQVDTIMLGGLMGQTFLRARDGQGEGFEPASCDSARAMLDLAKHHGVEVLLPVDGLTKSGEAMVVPFQEPAFDIGEKTLTHWLSICAQTDQVIWNGPLGMFEDSKFQATATFAKGLARIKGDVMIGGGETLSVIDKAMRLRYHYVSTGGGAFLYFLEHGEFPCQLLVKRNYA